MLTTVAQVHVGIMIGLAHVDVEWMGPTSVVREVLFATSSSVWPFHSAFYVVAINTSCTTSSLLSTVSLPFPHHRSLPLRTSSIPVAGACNFVRSHFSLRGRLVHTFPSIKEPSGSVVPVYHVFSIATGIVAVVTTLVHHVIKLGVVVSLVVILQAPVRIGVIFLAQHGTDLVIVHLVHPTQVAKWVGVDGSSLSNTITTEARTVVTSVVASKNVSPTTTISVSIPAVDFEGIVLVLHVATNDPEKAVTRLRE